jgi:hypothetical protein
MLFKQNPSLLSSEIISTRYGIIHKFSGLTVADILKQKKGSIKQARLPQGSPDWDEFSQMTWEEIEAGAKANQPGFKVVRKLITDKRFDR